MKSTTLVTALTGLTRAMAVAAAIVVFGFLYVLLVQPQRAASLKVKEQLEAARSELSHQRTLFRSAVPATAQPIVDEFETRAMEGDRVAEVVNAVSALLGNPAAGVSNPVVETGAPGDGPVESIAAPLSRGVSHTPVTVTFDAPYEQVGRFLASLRTLPATFDLLGVELAQRAASSAAPVRATVSLLVFHRAGLSVRSGVLRPRGPVTNSPPPLAAVRPAPSPPVPVVTSIVISAGRGVALVDGQVVRPGDRLRAGVIQAIEPDAVVIAGPGGHTRRIAMEKREFELAGR